jgi:hypothetical protein
MIGHVTEFATNFPSVGNLIRSDIATTTQWPVLRHLLRITATHSQKDSVQNHHLRFITNRSKCCKQEKIEAGGVDEIEIAPGDLPSDANASTSLRAEIAHFNSTRSFREFAKPPT